MRLLPLLLAAVSITSVCLSQDGVVKDGVLKDGSIDFSRDVRPILSTNCYACHGPDDEHRKAGLRLDTREGATHLDEGSAAVVPGDPARSVLLSRVRATGKKQMPPKDSGNKLSPKEIDVLERWIKSGAKWSEHWSYRPLEKPRTPKPAMQDWPRSDLDAFVLEKLDQMGLKPAAAADRYQLARRASLALIGLPPERSTVERFVRDDRPGAYERYVDRLLASPRFGEHWAGAWLDLARYADTNGYEKDSRRSIWRFRDWVIDAFNADMPFDQFTIEQLAGDLLPNATTSQKLATAFHRNTMTNTEGGTDDEEYRVAAVVDRINTTMQVWMGTTAGCAQCHNHKYDPITQKEYYQLFAYFNQTADADRGDNSPKLSTPTVGELLARKRQQEKVDALRADLKALNASKETDKKKTLETLIAKEAKALSALRLTTTPVLQELPEAKQRKSFVHIRGSHRDRGPEVEAATPTALHSFPKEKKQDRLGFATWLLSSDNPLTARVLANRIWERIFGMGIVETSEDFGAQGAAPSHPELLDWLAVRVRDGSWSVKKLCRDIVLSQTFRQASHVTTRKKDRDPLNRFFSRGPRFRLSAEAVRDQALAVSGLLSHKIHGPSVMPPQPPGIWQVVYSGDRWRTSPGEDKFRRGLYTFWRRTSPYPAMMTFDATSREVCSVRRIRTNTPLQALVTLNDPAFVEAAQALAQRTYDAAEPNDLARATWMFQTVLVRPASETEAARAASLLKQVRDQLSKNPDDARKLASGANKTPKSSREPADPLQLAALTVLGNVLLNLDEVLIRN